MDRQKTANKEKYEIQRLKVADKTTVKMICLLNQTKMEHQVIQQDDRICLSVCLPAYVILVDAPVL